MEIEFKNENGILTVKLIGKLDTMTAPKLEEELSKKINEVQEIIFDLETLKYISSSGIRVLLTIKKKIGNMKVLKPTDVVMEVFEITGLSDVFDIEK